MCSRLYGTRRRKLWLKSTSWCDSRIASVAASERRRCCECFRLATSSSWFLEVFLVGEGVFCGGSSCEWLLCETVSARETVGRLILGCSFSLALVLVTSLGAARSTAVEMEESTGEEGSSDCWHFSACSSDSCSNAAKTAGELTAFGSCSLSPPCSSKSLFALRYELCCEFAAVT